MSTEPTADVVSTVAIFTKSEVTAGSVKNSKAVPPEFTRNFCEALPIESVLSQIPPEPEASTFHFVASVGRFHVVEVFAT